LPVTLHVASQFFLPTTIANPKKFFGFSSRITSKFILSFVAHSVRHSIKYHSWPFSLRRLRIQICLVSRLAHCYARLSVWRWTLCKSLYTHYLCWKKNIPSQSKLRQVVLSVVLRYTFPAICLLSSVVLKHQIPRRILVLYTVIHK